MTVHTEGNNVFRFIDRGAETKNLLRALENAVPKPQWDVETYKDAAYVGPKLAMLTTKAAFLLALSRTPRHVLFIDFELTHDSTTALEFSFLLCIDGRSSPHVPASGGKDAKTANPILRPIRGGHYVAVDPEDLTGGTNQQVILKFCRKV